MAKNSKAQKTPAHPLMISDKSWNRESVLGHVADQLATSSLGLGNILKAGYEGHILPGYSTFMLWLEQDAKLLDRYTRAKEAQADFMADEMLNIADDGKNDWMERQGADGAGIGWQLNGEHVQRSKLRIESRKWLASKLKPKKYGERTTLSGDPDNPITTRLIIGS